MWMRGKEKAFDIKKEETVLLCF